MLFPWIDIYSSPLTGEKKSNLTIFIQDLLCRELDTPEGVEKVSFMKKFLDVGSSLGKYENLLKDAPNDLESYQMEIKYQFKCCLRTVVLLYVEKENPRSFSYFSQDAIEEMFWASCLLGFDFGIRLFNKKLKDLIFKDYKNKTPIEKYMVEIQRLKVEKLDPVLFMGLCLTKEGEVKRQEASKTRDQLWHEILEAV